MFLIDFPWGAFLLRFSSHLLLVGTLAVVFGILFARLGWAMGLPRLFWHEIKWKQAVAGFSVALLVAKVLFVGYLLDERALFNDQADITASTTKYLVGGGISVIIAGAAAFTALWIRRKLLGDASPWSPEKVSRWPMLAGMLLGVATAAVIGRLSVAMFEELAFETYVQNHTFASLDPGLARVAGHHFLAAIFVLFLASSFLFSALTPTHRLSTPATAICTLLCLVVATHGFIVTRFNSHVVLLLVATAAIALGGWPKDKIRIRALKHWYANPPKGSAARLRLDATRRNPKGPLVLVAVSGGGLRSAVWTTAVLKRLEEIEQFPYHVGIIAGASGGMVGAAYYCATLLDPKIRKGDAYHSKDPFECTNVDALSGVAERLVYRDLPRAFFPIPSVLDSRGEALEEGLAKGLRDPSLKTMGLLAGAEQQGWMPSLAFSPMLVEDGRRLLISNLDLSFISDTVGPSVRGRRTYSECAWELAQLIPDAMATLPVLTAARLSASFPYVTPAAVLPPRFEKGLRRRVVDAGYYDNYGINVICGWLDEYTTDPLKKKWLDQHSGILVIEIRDGIDERFGPIKGKMKDASTTPISRGLEGVLSPPSAVLAARESVPIFRNDEQLELLSRGFRDDFFTTAKFEFAGDASLSWYLAAEERKKLWDGSGDGENATELAKLKQWWSSHLR